MRKTVGSQPEATTFRSLAVILLVLVLITFFFYYSENINDEVDQAAKRKTISEINSALALTLYQMAIDSRLDELPNLSNSNPFVYLAIHQSLPTSYYGSVENLPLSGESGWYYEMSSNQVVYMPRNGDAERYRVSFRYRDSNSSRHFEPEFDSIFGLELKKAP